MIETGNRKIAVNEGASLLQFLLSGLHASQFFKNCKFF